MLLYSVHKCKPEHDGTLSYDQARTTQLCHHQESCIDLMLANSRSKVPTDGDKGDSRQGGKRRRGSPGPGKIH